MRIEYIDTLINLAALASAPYDSFVYGDILLAKKTQRSLIEQGAGDFPITRCRLEIAKGELIGMIAALTGTDLTNLRLRTAMIMSKNDLFAKASPVRHRTQLANKVMMRTEANDYYVSRLAILPTARKQGLGQGLLEQTIQDGKKLGCKRLVLEVNPDHQAAVRLYRNLGFEQLDHQQVLDPDTKRTLEYLHLTKPLQ